MPSTESETLVEHLRRELADARRENDEKDAEIARLYEKSTMATQRADALREQLAAARKEAAKAREDALEEARKACSGKRWGIDCAVAIRELKR